MMQKITSILITNCFYSKINRTVVVLDDESTTAKETHAVTLDSVLNALRSLGAPIDVEHTAPTKQGGS